MLRALNDSAARVWELSDGTRSAEAIAATLAMEFEAAPEAVAADTFQFLTLLGELGLVEDQGARE